MQAPAQSKATFGVSKDPRANPVAHAWVRGRAGAVQDGLAALETFLVKWLADQGGRVHSISRHWDLYQDDKSLVEVVLR